MVEPKQSPGVDSRSNTVVDPTKNVEDLIKARDAAMAELRTADQRFLDARLTAMDKLHNFAREADSKIQGLAREAGEKLEAALRSAETIRINELAATRKSYEDTIRDMLAKSVESTSSLVSTQLVQIQATFDKRVSQLEAFQFTQAGKSSVSDPALARVLAEMTETMRGLTRSETKTDTRREGIANLGAIIIGTAIVIATAISITAFIISHSH